MVVDVNVRRVCDSEDIYSSNRNKVFLLSSCFEDMLFLSFCLSFPVLTRMK